MRRTVKTKLIKSKQEGKNNLEIASFGRKKTFVGIVIGTILGAIIFGGIGVVAVNLSAEEVSYTPQNSNFQVDNAKDALDEIYTKVAEGIASKTVTWLGK